MKFLTKTKTKMGEYKIEGKSVEKYWTDKIAKNLVGRKISMFFEETTVWTVRMFYSTKLWRRNPTLQQSNSKLHFFLHFQSSKKTP